MTFALPICCINCKRMIKSDDPASEKNSKNDHAFFEQVSDAGIITGCPGNFKDERKKVEWVLQQSETNLHTIFDNTDTIYILIDTDFRIVSYNQRARDFAKKELG